MEKPGLFAYKLPQANALVSFNRLSFGCVSSSLHSVITYLEGSIAPPNGYFLVVGAIIRPRTSIRRTTEVCLQSERTYSDDFVQVGREGSV